MCQLSSEYYCATSWGDPVPWVGIALCLGIVSPLNLVPPDGLALIAHHSIPPKNIKQSWKLSHPSAQGTKRRVVANKSLTNIVRDFVPWSCTRKLVIK